MTGGMRLWTGLVISVVLMALFLLTVDAGRMVDAVVSANYWYVAPAIGLYLVSILFRTLRWQRLLRHMKHVGLWRLYPVVVIGYMANDILPMRLGELVRSYYVGEREGISKASALVTVFVERLMDALTLLLFIAVVAVFVPLIGLAEAFGERSGLPWPVLAAALSLPFIGAFIALLVLATAPSRARALTIRLVKTLPKGLGDRLLPLVDTFLEALKPLRSLRTVLVLFSLSVPIWLFEVGLFFLIGISFELHELYDSLWDLAIALVLVTAIANIGSSVPAAPGGIGLFELVARETLVLLPLAAVDRALAGGYVVVVHAALLLPMIVLGQVFLLAQHLSLGSLWKAGQAASDGGVQLSNVAELGDEQR